MGSQTPMVTTQHINMHGMHGSSQHGVRDQDRCQKYTFQNNQARAAATDLAAVVTWHAQLMRVDPKSIYFREDDRHHTKLFE